MYKKAFIISLLLIAGTQLSIAYGQGEVYLFGQVLSSVSAVKIPEVARLKSIPSQITINTRGNGVKGVRTVLYNNTSKLHLSSVSDKSGSRVVSAAVTSGSAHGGATLKLAIKNPAYFNGDPGEITQEIELNSSNKVVVSDIRNCYSGKGLNDGYNLEFIYEIPANASQIQNNKASITVTLTLASEV